MVCYCSDGDARLYREVLNIYYELFHIQVKKHECYNHSLPQMRNQLTGLFLRFHPSAAPPGPPTPPPPPDAPARGEPPSTPGDQGAAATSATATQEATQDTHDDLHTPGDHDDDAPGSGVTSAATK